MVREILMRDRFFQDLGKICYLWGGRVPGGSLERRFHLSILGGGSRGLERKGPITFPMTRGQGVRLMPVREDGFIEMNDWMGSSTIFS